MPSATEILAKFEMPEQGNLWRVQGTAVIYHRALERIAAQEGISFDPPVVLRATKDEAVLLVTARIEARDGRKAATTWSIGEAAVGVNYRVSGKQAAYVWAMSEKRGKDRCILKLLEIDDAVDEAEADATGMRDPSRPEPEPEPERPQDRRERPASGSFPPRTPQDAQSRMTASQQTKTDLIEALYKVEPAKVEKWLQLAAVKRAMAEIDEVHRLDVERYAEERKAS